MEKRFHHQGFCRPRVQSNVLKITKKLKTQVIPDYEEILLAWDFIVIKTFEYSFLYQTLINLIQKYDIM